MGKTKHQTWAESGPSFVPGQRIWAYAADEPGEVVGPDPRSPGNWVVQLDGRKKPSSIAWDNLAAEPGTDGPYG